MHGSTRKSTVVASVNEPLQLQTHGSYMAADQKSLKLRQAKFDMFETLDSFDFVDTLVRTTKINFRLSTFCTGFHSVTDSDMVCSNNGNYDDPP